jgi:hypothetical protein
MHAAYRCTCVEHYQTSRWDYARTELTPVKERRPVHFRGKCWISLEQFVYILFLPKRTVYQNCFAIWYSCPSLKLNTRILLTNTRLQRKAEYESQLKSLHSKIQHMESEAHKHQAQLMQHQLRANQIASLQQSLLDAKTQVLFVTCNYLFVCLILFSRF